MSRRYRRIGSEVVPVRSRRSRPGRSKAHREGTTRSGGKFRRLLFEPLEPRVLLSGDLTYMAIADGALTLRLDPTDSDVLQIVETGTDQVLAWELLSNLTGAAGYGARIDGGGFDVELTIDESAIEAQLLLDAGGIVFDAGSGVDNDTLVGPNLPSDWNLTGRGEGNIDGGSVRYTGVENLSGGAAADRFVLDEGGGILGLVEGGASGFDMLVVEGGEYETVTYRPTGAHSGSLELDGMQIAFAGMEPVDLTGGPVATHFVFETTDNPDRIRLLNRGQDGNGLMQIVSDDDGFEQVWFKNPTNTLRIDAGGGADAVTVESVDSGFVAELILHGGPGDDTLIGSAGDDAYTFVGGWGSDTIVDPGGVDTLDFGAFDGTLRLSNRRVEGGPNTLSWLEGTDLENLVNGNIALDGFDREALVTGLQALVDWAARLSAFEELGQPLALVAEDGDVSVGAAMDLAEALDQLRLEILNSTIQTSDQLVALLTDFDRQGITHLNRAIVGDRFDPVVTDALSFTFTLTLELEDGGFIAKTLTVDGLEDLTGDEQVDVDDLVQALNDRLDDLGVSDKVKALLKEDVDPGDAPGDSTSRGRIALQLTDPAVVSMQLSAVSQNARDQLGFRDGQTSTPAGLEFLGDLDVSIASITPVVDMGSGTLKFQIDYDAERTTRPVEGETEGEVTGSLFRVDLGNRSGGLLIDDALALETHLDAWFALGLETDSSFFVDFGENLPWTVLAGAGLQDAAGKVGILGVDATGTIELNADVEVLLSQFEGITIGQLEASLANPADPDSLVSGITPDAPSVNVDLSLAVAPGLIGPDGQPFDPQGATIKTPASADDPFVGRDLALDRTNFEALAGFDKLSPSDLFGLLAQLRGWFADLQNSALFDNVKVPFADASLGTAFDLAGTFSNEVFFDDLGGGLDASKLGFENGQATTADDISFDSLSFFYSVFYAGLEAGSAPEFASGNFAFALVVGDEEPQRIEVTDVTPGDLNALVNALNEVLPVGDPFFPDLPLQYYDGVVAFQQDGKIWLRGPLSRSLQGVKSLSVNCGLPRLIDQDDGATFGTAQELAQELGVDGIYDDADQRLTFAIDLARELKTVSVPVDFNLDLSPIAQVRINGSPPVELGGEATLKMTLGLELGGVDENDPRNLTEDTLLESLRGAAAVEDVVKDEFSLTASPATATLSYSGDQLAFEGASLHGNPPLTLTPVEGNTTEEVKLSRGEGQGSWIAEAFKPGQRVVVSGAVKAANNGTFEVVAVTETDLTLSRTAGEFVQEGPVVGLKVTALGTITRSSGSWLDEGFEKGQLITVAGSDDNNGRYVVAGISEDGFTLTLTTGLETETMPGQVAISRGLFVRLSENATFEIEGLASTTGQLQFRRDVEGDQIVRTDGSWIDDGFRPGVFITVSGSTDNDTPDGEFYRIASVSDEFSEDGSTLLTSTLTLEQTGELTNEAPVAPVTVEGIFAVAVLAGADPMRPFVSNTSNNTSLGDLAQDVNSALADAQLTGVLTASSDGTRLVLTRLNSVDAGFSLRPTSQVTQDELGFVLPAGQETLVADEADLLIGVRKLDAGEQVVHRVNLDGAQTIGDVIAKIAEQTGGSVAQDGTVTFGDVEIAFDPFDPTTGIAGLELRDTNSEPDLFFGVQAINGSPAAARLGILATDPDTDLNEDGTIDEADADGVIIGQAIGGVVLADRFFVQDPLLGGTLSLRTPGEDEGIDVFARYGFVDIKLQGEAGFDGQVSIELQDPSPATDFTISLAELLEGARYFGSPTDPAAVVSVPVVRGPSIDSGQTTLTFADNAGEQDERDTITRGDGGSWEDAGFAAGQLIRVEGSAANNDGIYTIAEIDSMVLILDPAVLADETTVPDPVVRVTAGMLNRGVPAVPANAQLTLILQGTVADGLIAPQPDPREIFVTLFDFSNSFVEFQNLGDLESFGTIGAAHVKDALEKFSQFLGEFEGYGFLGETLPVIDASLTDLLGVADVFDAGVAQYASNPAGSLQALETRLVESFGSLLDYDAGNPSNPFSPEDAVTLSLEEGILRIDLQLVRQTEDLLDILIDLGEDGVFSAPAAFKASEANAMFKLAFGVGLVDPLEVYVFDDTEITGDLSGDATISEVVAALGPFPVDVQDGRVSAQSETMPSEPTFGVRLNFGNGPKQVENALADATEVESVLDGLVIDAALPVAILTGDGQQGEVRYKVKAFVGTDGTLQTQDLMGPSIDFDLPEEFDLIDSKSLLGIGLEKFFAGLQDALEGGIFGLDLPLIGDQLRDATIFLDDFIVDVISPFAVGLTNDDGSTNADAAVNDPVSALLFELLGPGNDALVTDLNAALDNPDDPDDLGGRIVAKIDQGKIKLIAVDDTISGFELVDPNDVAKGELKLDAASSQPDESGRQVINGTLLEIADGRLLGGPSGEGDASFKLKVDHQEYVVTITKDSTADNVRIAGLLLDGQGLSGIRPNDIRFTPNVDFVNLNDSFIQWNFQIGGTLLSTGADIDFDLGIPGLGLETEGGIGLRLSWQLNLGFGLSPKDGFYIDISDAGEFRLLADVELAEDTTITGTLGFLQLTAENEDVTGDDKATGFGATFAVDVYNRKDDFLTLTTSSADIPGFRIELGNDPATADLLGLDIDTSYVAGTGAILTAKNEPTLPSSGPSFKVEIDPVGDENPQTWDVTIVGNPANLDDLVKAINSALKQAELRGGDATREDLTDRIVAAKEDDRILLVAVAASVEAFKVTDAVALGFLQPQKAASDGSPLGSSLLKSTSEDLLLELATRNKVKFSPENQQDATFSIKVAGQSTPVTVTIPYEWDKPANRGTSGNKNLDDLVADINYALKGTGFQAANSDTRLSLSELTKVGIRGGLAAEAVAELSLTLGVNPELFGGISGVFPKLQSDFHLNWGFGDRAEGIFTPLADVGDALVAGLQKVEFLEVGIDLGPFISDFAQPILEQIQDLTAPVKPIIAFLKSPLPLLSDFGVQVTVAELISAVGNVDLGFIDAVDEIITLVDSIPTQADSIVITFFDEITIFDPGAVVPIIPDLSNPNEDLSASPRTETDESLDDLEGQTAEFTKKLTKSEGFSFPVLTDASEIFKLMLGQTATLVEYDIPKLELTFSYEQFFPIVWPLGVRISGSLGATIDFHSIGFDTVGIQQFAAGGFQNPELIFNGFFINDLGSSGVDEPEVKLTGSLTGAAEINVVLLRGGVGGGVFADVTFDLNDPDGDGKIRARELIGNVGTELRFGDPLLAPLAIFDVEGAVTAELFAYIDRLKFSFWDGFYWSRIYRETFGEGTILDFDVEFARDREILGPALATDLGNGVLRLNMGEFAKERLFGDTSDGSETFRVLTPQGEGGLIVEATLDGETWEQTYFGDFKRIEAYGGQGDDTIDLSGVTDVSIEHRVEGGSGKDTIIGSAGGGIIRGGTGNDTITGGAGADEIFGDAGVDVLRGGAGVDVIHGGSESDQIFGEDGADTLFVAPDGTDTFDGGSDEDTLKLQSGAATWRITGDNAGSVNGQLFDRIENLEGGPGADRFVLEVGAGLAGEIDGADSVDTLEGPNADSTWNLANMNQGTVAGVAFLRIENLVGAGGTDTFVFANGARLTGTVVGGGGVNTLDYSAYQTRVEVDLSMGGATGTAGTQNIRDLLGGSVGDRLIGNDRDNVLRGLGGDDEIRGRGGSDLIYGGDGPDWIYGGTGVDRIEGQSDNDHLYGEDDRDYVLGGAGADFVSGGSGADVLLGDGGVLLFGNSTDGAFSELQSITGQSSGSDGADTLEGNAGSDIILGGAGGDTIWGDDATASAGALDLGDILLGDNGEVTLVDGAVSSIRTSDPSHGDADTLSGNAATDIILGGAGDDTLYGDAGTPGTNDSNDFLLGDYGIVALRTSDGRPETIATIARSEGGADAMFGNAGDDILIGGAAGDIIDGDGDDDLIFGDNALLDRTESFGDTTSPRFRALSGVELYDDEGNALIDLALQFIDPIHVPAWADWIVTLLSQGSRVRGRGASSVWNDYIAGGAGADTIFGQLGDDTIQGDGSIASKIAGTATYGAFRGPDPMDPLGNPDKLQITPSFDAETDGDDYIEGNAGADTIFGNLGQDDIIGGSSDLFGLTHRQQRQDGADIIFGGSGNHAGRNDLGEIDGVPVEDRHGRDADMILGDNGRIFRLVPILTFNYDNYGGVPIVPRAADLLDYTPGGADFDAPGQAGDIGTRDEIHGESGDDFIYGMAGHDLLFGDGQDDDIIGGYGHDWISGGTGDDGVLGDDGRLYTSRNGLEGEPLYGIPGFDPGELNLEIRTPGRGQVATINVAGELKKTASLTPFNVDGSLPDGERDPLFHPVKTPADDIIFGGWGNDFLHGGAGDDAISGAEALERYFDNPDDRPGADPDGGNVLRYGMRSDTNREHEFAAYDEHDPWRKILVDANGEFTTDGSGQEFLLNFDATEGLDDRGRPTDGNDRIFGDLGNDWLLGGSGMDNLYGGYGDDLLNADDDHDTTTGTADPRANDGPDDHDSYADRAYGGAGRDILIANTARDRLIDWVGEWNSYIVPFASFGAPTISRALRARLQDFLYDLSENDGADPTRAADAGTEAERNGEPSGELGLVTQHDADWDDQTGGPADPQQGHKRGQRDTIGFNDFVNNDRGTFFDEIGTSTVVRERLVIGDDVNEALSLMLLERGLPVNYHIETKFKTASWVHFVFDLESATDFKFAGFDVINDQLVIGRRTPEGWFVDASDPRNLSHARLYDVVIEVEGSMVILKVGGHELSHDFGPGQFLNGGYVGVGTRGGSAKVWMMKVDKEYDNFTLDQADHFIDGAAAWFTGGQSGSWQVTEENRYEVAAPSNGRAAISIMDLGHGSGINANALLNLRTTLRTDLGGGVVFDQYSADDFKYVALRPVTNEVVIGHHTAKHGWIDDAVAAKTLTAGADYSLQVEMEGARVKVFVDGVQTLEHRYNAATTDGGFGLLTIDGASSFASVAVQSDDPILSQPPGEGEPDPDPDPDPGFPGLELRIPGFGPRAGDRGPESATGGSTEIGSRPTHSAGLLTLDDTRWLDESDEQGTDWIVDLGRSDTLPARSSTVLSTNQENDDDENDQAALEAEVETFVLDDSEGPAAAAIAGEGYVVAPDDEDEQEV